MAKLSTKVKEYLKANGKTFADEKDNIELKNLSDGNGDFINSWNVSGLAQPTEEQLNAVESEANDLEALNQVISNRKNEYPTIEELVVALYDSEDRAAIDEKRAAVKLKHPKGV